MSSLGHVTVRFKRSLRETDKKHIVKGNLLDRPEYQDLDIRPSGRPVYNMPKTFELLTATTSVWFEMPNETHQGAWSACGYQFQKKYAEEHGKVTGIAFKHMFSSWEGAMEPTVLRQACCLQ